MRRRRAVASAVALAVAALAGGIAYAVGGGVAPALLVAVGVFLASGAVAQMEDDTPSGMDGPPASGPPRRMAVTAYALRVVVTIAVLWAVITVAAYLT